MRACHIEQDISETVDALVSARSPAQVRAVLTVTLALSGTNSHTCPLHLHQVGLLLGRLGVGQRDFIFHIIRTPSFEARLADPLVLVC